MPLLNKDFTNKPSRVYAFLIVLGATFFIGLGAFHLFDWDEINFAESSREMMLTGDYLHVQVNFQPFWEKPPLFMWLQVISMSVFGIGEFAARFPNALFAIIYLITFYLIGKKHHSPQFGIIWGVLFTTSLLPHIYFKSGVIDPVFNYFIFLSIYFMFRVLSNSESIGKYALYSGLFSGLSLLTKGPVGFLLLGLTLLVYLIITRFKKFPKFRYIFYFFVAFLGTISIWLFWEFLTNGTENLWKFIIYQAELFNSNVAGHEQPFYYHFVIVFFGCFPIAQLALPSFLKGNDSSGIDMRRWMQILFWVVLILFSIVTTKIIHYSSMTYIPLAYLATIYVNDLIDGKRSIPKWLMITFLVVGLLVGTAIAIVTFIFQNPSDFNELFSNQFTKDCMSVSVHWFGFEYLIGILFIIGVSLAFYYMINGTYKNAIYILFLNTLICLTSIQFLVIPKIEDHTQGPMIEMLESLKGKDCYVNTYGFKSYAHYFYADVKPGQVNEDHGRIINKKTNKPAYFIIKSDRTELDNNPKLELISKKGGYKLYVRK